MKAYLLTMICALALAAPAAAQTADITGKWDLSIMAGQGTPPAPMVLKKDGDKIVGTITSPQGEVPIEATVKEKAVTIAFTVTTQNGPIAITLTGTADGDAMKGAADFGGRGGAEWSATRSGPPAAGNASAPASAAKVDVTGTWAIEVTTDAGTGTPTFVLKQEGEKVTDSRTGQLGEAPISGTLKGNAIALAIDLSVQGTNIRIAYTGVADGPTMKGTVSLGDLGGGTFTGKKK